MKVVLLCGRLKAACRFFIVLAHVSGDDGLGLQIVLPQSSALPTRKSLNRYKSVPANCGFALTVCSARRWVTRAVHTFRPV